MAIPAGVIRLSHRGHSPMGEQWEFSVWTEPSTPPADENALLNYASAAAAIVTDTDVLPIWQKLIRSDSGLDEVRAYFYGNGGTKATLVASAEAIIVGAASGGLPLQCAVVVTTLTGLAGRSRRGRAYLPASGYATSPGTHVLSTADATAFATAFATYLSTLKAPADPYPAQTPVVVSGALSATAPIVQVAVDTKIDIQRRRANRQTGSVKEFATVS